MSRQNQETDILKKWSGNIIKTLLSLLIGVCTYYVTTTLDTTAKVNQNIMEKLSKVEIQLATTSSLLDSISKREDSLESRLSHLEVLQLSSTSDQKRR